MDKIAVLVPCYNESRTIKKVVEDFKRVLPEAVIYIYDNNSTDGTDEIARAAGACHVELTTLIVPGENDSPEEMEQEAMWIGSVGREIPLHVTRFFPRYHMTDREATDTAKVYDLADRARKYLKHVFVGNC